MTDKVVSLFGGPVAAPEDDGQYVASLPTQEQIDAALSGKKMQGVIVLLLNEDGQLASFVDGVTPMTLIGILEAVKHSHLNQGVIV